MKILAYLIWGALGGCIIIGVLVFVYAHLRATTKTRDNHTPVVETSPLTTFAGLNEKRWEQLIKMFNLRGCSLPATAQERIAWAQEYLGIEPAWLAGEDVPMFPFLSFHNAVKDGVNYIRTLKHATSDAVLYVVKPRATLMVEEIMDACAVLCFATPVTYAGGSTWRYAPVNVYWEWGYPPERVQCAQIIYTAMQAGVEIKGVEVEHEEIYALVEGKHLPATLLENPASSWDPRALASAGEDLAGVRKGMLSAQELMETISDCGREIEGKA
ncbi:MAG: hypothetical protein RBR02_04510 [Desulfuromonadaceae bacterium]|nr:hypothetical protein [Desulfuromonadaceae bacterium]